MRFELLALALTAAGCFDSRPPDGAFQCAPAPHACPSGTWCAFDGTCWQNGHAPHSLALLAGHLGGGGWRDGTGADARFYDPVGITAEGNDFLVADYGNGTIRRVTSGGVVTTVCGTAQYQQVRDGEVSQALFETPVAIATDGAGRIFVAQPTMIRVIALGQVSTFAGTGDHGSTDGPAGQATFGRAEGLAWDAANGALYVADPGNKTIRKIAGGMVTTVAGIPGKSGSDDGPMGTFSGPNDVAVDGAGILYVADQDNHSIRKVEGGVISTLAGNPKQSGTGDGHGAAALFDRPQGITLDPQGNLVVVQRGSGAIRRVTPAGDVTTLVKDHGSPVSDPRRAAVDSAGNVFIADSESDSVYKVDSNGGVTWIAGRAYENGGNDGVGETARWTGLAGITFDRAGTTAYVVDSYAELIKKVTLDGTVTTITGHGLGHVDGTLKEAQFNLPVGIAVDDDGTIYISETFESADIRKISTDGMVSTIAGMNGVTGTADGVGSAARFRRLGGMVIDHSHILYAVDQGTLRKITRDGAVTTLIPGDQVGGVAIGPDDTLYVYGGPNISRVTPDGQMIRIAGDDSGGYADGPGPDARFRGIKGITVDGNGNLYVSDSANATIRRIAPDHSVTTVVGVRGFGRVVPGPLPAEIGGAGAIAWSPLGALVVTQPIEESLLVFGPP